jgi:nucleotide-binding universal stress UspA family protein
MFRTILVPLDGSPLAERALPYAVELARRARAQLVLFQAIPLAEAASAADDETPPLAMAESYLRDLASRCDDVAMVETRVVVGDAGRAILDEIDRGAADLVVLSTHGRSGLGRWIYGSVADQVMREACVPIVLVPAHGRYAWPAEKPRRILVALDGSIRAERVLAPAEALAAALDAEMILLRVVELYPMGFSDPTGGFYVDPTPDLKEARRYLAEVAWPLVERGRKVQVDDELGFTVARIVDVAQQNGVSLIAIGTHGRGGLERLVLGSVATGVVQLADLPMLVMRSNDLGSTASPPVGDAAGTTAAGDAGGDVAASNVSDAVPVSL